jgi:hypothetical protein
MSSQKIGRLSQVSRISLLVSLTLVIFGLISSVFYLGFSLAVFQLDLKDSFFSLDQNIRYGFIFFIIFAVMSCSLIFSEKWLNPRLEEIEESLESVSLFYLSFFLTLVMLGLFYFGFSMYLSFINNRFWI